MRAIRSRPGRREAWGRPWPPLYASVAGPPWVSCSLIDLPTANGQRQRRPLASRLSQGMGALFTAAVTTVLSQRRAFRWSTSIARRWGHKSIWATHSALVFALRLLRLGRPAIGSYWSLPATEYRRKAARGSLQPELAFPSERQVSGQSTNIAPRGGRRSISAMLLARVFAPRRPRSSSWLRVPNSGRVAGARQRIPIRVGIESALEPASAQFARHLWSGCWANGI